MRLPEWARNDCSARLKFFCQIMAIHYSRDCTVVRLTEAAGLHYNSVIRAQENGRMSKRLALALTETAKGSGVQAAWLVAPEFLRINEDGEIS